MSKKKIILTFDYELFFGEKSGTTKKCLLEPTNRLIEICDAYNVKTTFFVDVMFYKKLLEVDCKQAEDIEKQLQFLVSNGHRIELHLHPHWLDAEYKNGEWKFKSYRYYRIHNLEDEKIVKLFVEGKQILENIANKVDNNYKVVGFRAGGWCIQPFKKLANAFKESRLIIDSSAAYGIKGESEVHWFDFSNIPNKDFYYFTEFLDKEKILGDFIEFPISTYKTNIFYKIFRKLKKYFKKQDYSIYGDGKGIALKRSLLNEVITYDMFTLESVEPKKLYNLCSHYDKEYINIISHPKGLSNISFKSLEYLINSNEFDFINIEEFYKEINNENSTY